MRKILCRALLCLCLVLALGPVHTAFAQDLDRIESYVVDVTPNTITGTFLSTPFPAQQGAAVGVQATYRVRHGQAGVEAA